MLSTALAEFVTRTKVSGIDGEALTKSQDALIDTLGVMLVGIDEDACRIAREWSLFCGGKPQASIVGTGLKTSVADAAFVNGLAAHVLDFDDSHAQMQGHPSAIILPTAFAVGELLDAGGDEVLAAFAIGVEVGARVGLAMGRGHYVKGWHKTSTVGVFVATAVAARFWQLSPAQLQTAWGIAASQISGLIRNFGTMTKPSHAGLAARVGVYSAWMARHGFTADTQVFDGEDSIFATYGVGDGVPVDDLLKGLGEQWAITEPGVSTKRWPCCFTTHRPIAAIADFVEANQIAPGDIERVEIGFLPNADRALVRSEPASGLEGKFSMEYTAAAIILDRRIDMASFTDEAVARPEVRTLMAKVHRQHLPPADPNGPRDYMTLRVDAKSKRLETRLERVPGSSMWPLTEAQRSEKFLGCAGPALGGDAAARLLEMARHTAELPNIRELVDLACPAMSKSAA